MPPATRFVPQIAPQFLRDPLVRSECQGAAACAQGRKAGAVNHIPDRLDTQEIISRADLTRREFGVLLLLV